MEVDGFAVVIDGVRELSVQVDNLGFFGVEREVGILYINLRYNGEDRKKNIPSGG